MLIGPYPLNPAHLLSLSLCNSGDRAGDRKPFSPTLEESESKPKALCTESSPSLELVEFSHVNRTLCSAPLCVGDPPEGLWKSSQGTAWPFPQQFRLLHFPVPLKQIKSRYDFLPVCVSSAPG